MPVINKDLISLVLGLEKEMKLKIKDSLYETVYLTEGENELIQQEELFGRLKKIHQLGASDRKYPGATHTRFEHSIGTLEVTWRLLKHILKTNSDVFSNLIDNIDTFTRLIWALRYSALLHDLGHGPFSHSLEIALKKNNKTFDHDEFINFLLDPIDKKFTKIKLYRKLQSHKKIKFLSNTLRKIIERDRGSETLKYIGLILSGNQYAIYKLKNEKKGIIELIPLFHDMIKGDFGSDRLDYLVRDTEATGIGYRPNVEEVIDSLCLQELLIQHPFKLSNEIENNKYKCFKLGIDIKSLNSAEFLLTSRLYHYYLIAYEKSNKIFEYLFSKSINEYFSNDNNTLEKLIIDGIEIGDNVISTTLKFRFNFQDLLELKSYTINEITMVAYRFFFYVFITAINPSITEAYIEEVKNNIIKSYKEDFAREFYHEEIIPRYDEIQQNLIIIPINYKPIISDSFIKMPRLSYIRNDGKGEIRYSPFLIDHSILIRKGITKNAIRQTRIDIYLDTSSFKLNEIEKDSLIWSLNNSSPHIGHKLFEKLLEHGNFDNWDRTSVENKLINDLEGVFFFLASLLDDREEYVLNFLKKDVLPNFLDVSYKSDDLDLLLIKLLATKIGFYSLTKLTKNLYYSLTSKQDNPKPWTFLSEKIKDNFNRIWLKEEVGEKGGIVINWELVKNLLILDALGIFEMRDVPSEGYDYSVQNKRNLFRNSYAIIPYERRTAIYWNPIKFNSNRDYEYPNYVFREILKYYAN